MASSKPKLSVKTPDAPDYNTLLGTHDSIIALPRERRYALIEFRTKKLDTDIASGEQQATIEIVHIEQPATSADETAVVAILDKMFKARTNLVARPAPDQPDTPLDLSGLAPTKPGEK